MMKPSFSPKSSKQVLEIIYGYQLAHCAQVAARLNIAELLFESPRSIVELAQITGVKSEYLYRLLRLLAAEGIFREIDGNIVDEKVFEFTPAAAALHKNTIGSVKPFLLAMMGELSVAFSSLQQGITEGKSSLELHYQLDIWQYYEQHPEQAENFNNGMAGLTQYFVQTVIPAYNFNDFNRIIDIGGGNGALLLTILAANRNPTGVIFDSPSVVEKTTEIIRHQNMASRCTILTGNFFESIPSGHDLYLLKYILHDWNDEQCIQILRNCANAMSKGNKILIVEAIIPSGNTYHAGKHSDITMLACTQGRERTEAEFRVLFTAAGLKINKVIELPIQEISLIEGEPI
ncbi:methyltransferase [Yersinia nurmii]|uniref:Methyltransferase n=1 Tax=Yersinia nurmii TaxID=685706 RepID=A0AAW7K7X2_9GAMM|nr:methyltransferase [Yersinia nurmii]MDN0087181.1 methyltransferase [Yersinia nurmii]